MEDMKAHQHILEKITEAMKMPEVSHKEKEKEK